jgi:hypothetical protein
MVYSRATTSAMAERPCLPAGFCAFDDISAMVSCLADWEIEVFCRKKWIETY